MDSPICVMCLFPAPPLLSIGSPEGPSLVTSLSTVEKLKSVVHFKVLTVFLLVNENSNPLFTTSPILVKAVVKPKAAGTWTASNKSEVVLLKYSRAP